ncbi:MAG: TIGR00730 family Rossman fold protein [Marinifilaceae bacterium]
MNITLFCSSSNDLPKGFNDAAEKLGELICQHQWSLVYGGTDAGLMKRCADQVIAGGCRTIGIIPECIYNRGVQSTLCKDLIVTPDMKERKELMRVQADAFIALPGGWGTLEEIVEVVTLKQLGELNKPIVFVNIDGYFDLFFSFINKASQLGVIKREYDNIYHVSTSVEDAVQYILDYNCQDIVSKY